MCCALGALPGRALCGCQGRNWREKQEEDDLQLSWNCILKLCLCSIPLQVSGEKC